MPYTILPPIAMSMHKKEKFMSASISRYYPLNWSAPLTSKGHSPFNCVPPLSVLCIYKCCDPAVCFSWLSYIWQYKHRPVDAAVLILKL